MRIPFASNWQFNQRKSQRNFMLRHWIPNKISNCPTLFVQSVKKRLLATFKNSEGAANKKIGKTIESAKNFKWRNPNYLPIQTFSVWTCKLPKFPCVSIREDRYLQEVFNEYKKMMILHGILLLLASSFATSNDLFRESVVQQEVVPG